MQQLIVRDINLNCDIHNNKVRETRSPIVVVITHHHNTFVCLWLVYVIDNDKVNRDIMIKVYFHEKLCNNQLTGGKWMTSLSGIQLRVTFNIQFGRV